MKWSTKPKTQLKTGSNIVPISLDGGINREDSIFNLNPSEAWDSNNVISREKGSIELFKAPITLENIPWGIRSYGICRNRKTIHILVNNTWRCATYNAATNSLIWEDINETEGILAGLYSTTFIDFQADGVLYTIMANEYEVLAWDGTTVTTLTDAPKTRMYTVDDYRLFALKDNVLYFSEKGDITDWSWGGIPLTGAKGRSTAIATCNDKVFCFTDQTLHILYGDDENNFSLSEIINYGCISYLSVRVKDNDVYFLGYNGLYRYTNGAIENLSRKLNLSSFSYSTWFYYRLCVFQDYIYVKSLDTHILDTNTWKWFSSFALVDSLDYIVNDDRGEMLLSIDDTHIKYVNHSNADTTTPWHHITGMRFEAFNKQTVGSLKVLYKLPADCTMELSYNTNPDNPSWYHIHTFENTTSTQPVTVDIPLTMLNNVDFYNLQFSGTGDFKIYSIGENKRLHVR